MITEITGGGCLDGGTAVIVSGSTYQCPESGTFYSIDDDTGHLAFAGHGPFGREMALIMSGFRRDARAGQAAEEAAKPRGCRLCGRTFGNESAWTVHFESGPGSRCLPGDAYGQLEQRDGVWVLAGSSAAR